MSWYNTQGPSSDLVPFSRVRYIRNIAKQTFTPRLDAKRSSDTASRLDSILTKNGFHSERPAAGVTLQMLSLAEKQFVTRDLVYSDKGRILYLNEPCNLVLTVGGDNYISIASVMSGTSVGEARRTAAVAEELIDRELSFAYVDGIGYLSPNPDECGSGLEFSTALYLPSVRRGAGSIRVSSLAPSGMTLTPMFSGKDESDLYILSYIPHYLCDEDSATRYFAGAVEAIATEEKARLAALTKDREREIYNSARRALGLLVYSERVSEHEMLSLLSDIRLAICSSDVCRDSLPTPQTLNYLLGEGLSASVCCAAREKCECADDCDKARALFISSYIEHKNEVKNVK